MIHIRSSWMTSALAGDPQLRVTAAVGSASDAERGKSETTDQVECVIGRVRHGSKWGIICQEGDFAPIAVFVDTATKPGVGEKSCTQIRLVPAFSSSIDLVELDL